LQFSSEQIRGFVFMIELRPALGLFRRNKVTVYRPVSAKMAASDPAAAPEVLLRAQKSSLVHM